MSSQAGGIIQGLGTIYSGIEQSKVADVEAQQLRINAGQVRAAGESAAAIARRQTEMVQSAQKAIAGASGAGVTDPTMQDVEAETGRSGEYKALAALYAANSEAQIMTEQAGLTTFAGEQAEISSFITAAGQVAGAPGGSGSGFNTLGEQGQSMFDKYAGDLPSFMVGG